MEQLKNVDTASANQEISNMKIGGKVVIDYDFMQAHQMDVKEFGQILAKVGFPETEKNSDGTETLLRPKTDQIFMIN